MQRTLIGLLAAAFLASGAGLDAATRTWTGAASTAWSDPANWGGTAPQAGDDLVFPSDAAQLTAVNDLPAGTAFASIDLAGGYTLDGSSVVLGSGGLSFGGLSTIHLPLTLGASQTWSGRIPASVSLTGTLDLNGATLRIEHGSVTLASTTVTGSGAIVADGAHLYARWTSLSYTGPLGFAGSSYSYVELTGSPFGSGIDVPTHENFGIGAGASLGGPLTVAADASVVWFGTSQPGSVQGLAAAAGSHVVVFDLSALVVNGSVSLDGARLTSWTIGIYPPLGSEQIVIDNDGTDPVVGTFEGLPEGAQLVDVEDGRVLAVSYQGGDGNDVTLTMLRAPVEITLASSPSPSQVGDPVTFTSVVTSPGGYGTPTGTVTLVDVSNPAPVEPVILAEIALDATGTASWTTTSLSAGDYVIEARYGGDGTHAPAETDVTQEVLQAPSAVTLTSAPNPSRLGETVAFTAVVTSEAGSGDPTGNVSFLEGAAVLATVPLGVGGTVAWTTSGLPVGPHDIVARYGGDSAHAPAESALVRQLVQEPVAVPLLDPGALGLLVAALAGSGWLLVRRLGSSLGA